MNVLDEVRHGAAPLSKRLLLSYVLDWVVLAIAYAFASAIARVKPNMRPFSLADPSISFPFETHTKVPTPALVAIAFVVPAIIVPLVCLFCVPGPTAAHSPRALRWRRKLWEWNTGWLGLALAVCSAYLLTNGMKNLFGKPRPDLISRCKPDLGRLKENVVGGLGLENDRAALLVAHTICRDQKMIRDGFRSFPSGHASSLTYLTLFLCSKFAIAIPFLAPRPYTRDETASAAFPRSSHRRLLSGDGVPAASGAAGSAFRKRRRSFGGADGDTSPIDHQQPLSSSETQALRNQAAAPPLHLLVVAFTPMCIAIYISATRFSDFRHHGFDILSGGTLGLASAWFGFRWYHLPVQRGAGWAWGARSRDRAFGVGVGVSGYVGDEGWLSTRAVHEAPHAAHYRQHGHRRLSQASHDIELGRVPQHQQQQQQQQQQQHAPTPSPMQQPPPLLVSHHYDQQSPQQVPQPSMQQLPRQHHHQQPVVSSLDDPEPGAWHMRQSIAVSSSTPSHSPSPSPSPRPSDEGAALR